MFAQAQPHRPGRAESCYFAEAATFIKCNRRKEDARQLADRATWRSNISPDDPPKSEARKLLKQVSGS